MVQHQNAEVLRCLRQPNKHRHQKSPGNPIHNRRQFQIGISSCCSTMPYIMGLCVRISHQMTDLVWKCAKGTWEKLRSLGFKLFIDAQHRNCESDTCLPVIPNPYLLHGDMQVSLRDFFTLKSLRRPPNRRFPSRDTCFCAELRPDSVST